MVLLFRLSQKVDKNRTYVSNDRSPCFVLGERRKSLGGQGYQLLFVGHGRRVGDDRAALIAQVRFRGCEDLMTGRTCYQRV
jgi:hypothetical protein